MHLNNRFLANFMLFLIDTIAVIHAFYLSLLQRYGVGYSVSANLAIEVREFVLILILISAVIHFLLSRSRGFMHRGYFIELGETFKFSGLLTALVIIFMYLAHIASTVSRLQIIYLFAYTTLIAYLLRLLVKFVVKNYFDYTHAKKNVLLILDTDSLSQVLSEVNFGTTYHVCGVIEVDCNGKAVGTVNHRLVESSIDCLTKDLVTFTFDEVLIRMPSHTARNIYSLIQGFEDMGVACHYAIALPDLGGKYSHIGQFGDYQVITYAITHPDPRALVLKRLMDIIGSLIGLVFFAIIYIFLAPAIKLDSKGPVIFAQTRIGRNGKKFKFYKFRSMCSDADAKKKELMKQNEVNSTLMFKMEDDPRITKVGKFIRKTSLDEFPQFWNVLKGDMSLVGTRPPTVEEYEQYSEHYRRRLSMTPGITGMWQVSGRSEIKDFDEVVKLDLKYIDHWSLALDFKILFMTVAQVLVHKGAK